MAQTGCRRVVLASSFAVYDWSGSGDLDEDSPVETAPDLYGERYTMQGVAGADYGGLAASTAGI